MHRKSSRRGRTAAALLLLCLATTRAAQANEALLTLTGLSMKVPAASLNLLGSEYRLAFSTADDDSINGELYALGSNQWESFAILDYPGSEALGPLAGVFEVETPMAGDSNINGVTDFLEVDRAIPATTTTGTIEIDDGMDFSRGTVTATWTRPAGSAFGTVQVKVNLPDFGFQDLTFNHPFEIFQYKGTLTYTRVGDAVTASVVLPRQGAEGSFTGSMPMTRTSEFDLDRAAVTWKGPGGLDFDLLGSNDIEDAPLPINYVTQRFYAGLIVLADGDPTTPFADEFDYLDLIIEDLNDADGDRLPDLTDTLSVAPPRPTLAATLATGSVRVQVAGGLAGGRVAVERSPVLPASEWTLVGEVTLDAAGKGDVNAGAPTGDRAYFRTRAL